MMNQWKQGVRRPKYDEIDVYRRTSQPMGFTCLSAVAVAQADQAASKPRNATELRKEMRLRSEPTNKCAEMVGLWLRTGGK